MATHRLLLMFPLIIFAETRCTSVQTDASKTIPLKDALSIVETEVRETYPVALSDIGTASDDKIRSALLQAQCFDNSPNPFVPVITGAISIGIQGSLQQQGGATVGGIIAAPAASLSYQVTEGKQQSLTIPVTFVSLAGLPNFFMGQNLANLSNLGATDSTRKRLTADIIARAQNLTKLVKVAITKYYANLDKCGKPGAPTLLPMVPLDLKLPKEQEVKLPDDIPSIPQNNKPPSLKLPQ